MAFRTTPAKVIAVMGAFLMEKIINPTTTGLLPFIVVANEMTTEICGNVGYTDLRLEMIETWLAAHFATLAIVRQSVQEHAGEVGESFAPFLRGDITAGFASTRFGDGAITMDTAGGLLRSAYRQSKGLLKRTDVGIYGGSRNQFPNVDTDFNQPGFFPG